MKNKKLYIVQFDRTDGSSIYHCRLKGDFCGTDKRELATVFQGKKYAEREADKMLQQDNYLVCYSILEA